MGYSIGSKKRNAKMIRLRKNRIRERNKKIEEFFNGNGNDKITLKSKILKSFINTKNKLFKKSFGRLWRRSLKKQHRPQRGCTNQSHTKKYRSRGSPPYPANLCRNKKMKGNDGHKYISSQRGRSRVYRWYKIK